MAQPLLLAFCAFLMLMVLLSWVGYRLIYKPGRFLRQLGQPVISLDARRTPNEGGEAEASTLVTVLHQPDRLACPVVRRGSRQPESRPDPRGVPL
jgi:hypothetical protein